jgi:hypothetical protein
MSMIAGAGDDAEERATIEKIVLEPRSEPRS